MQARGGVVGDPGQHVGEPGARIGVVEFGRGDERIHGRGALAAAVGPGEQPTGEGFLYLAAIKDMATREIVGWSMADHLRAELCIDALVMPDLNSATTQVLEKKIGNEIQPCL
jgi:hypothetical protein